MPAYASAARPSEKAQVAFALTGTVTLADRSWG
jgi:hypothetical protein